MPSHHIIDVEAPAAAQRLASLHGTGAFPFQEFEVDAYSPSLESPSQLTILVSRDYVLPISPMFSLLCVVFAIFKDQCWGRYKVSLESSSWVFRCRQRQQKWLRLRLILQYPAMIRGVVYTLSH